MAGFNFRATSGYVTDDAGDTYVLSADAYPTSRGGETFGYATAAPQHINRNSGVDARLAGILNVSNPSADTLFVVDTGNGSFDVSLAIGDPNNFTQPLIEICDVNTSNVVQSVLATLDGTSNIVSGSWLDASGVVRSDNTDWINNNASTEVTVSSGRLGIRLGNTPSGTSSLAHLDVTSTAPARSITDIDTDNDVQAGQTNVTITTVGLDASPATQTATLGGETLTVNSWSATAVNVDIPLHINLEWGSTTNQLSLTDDTGTVTLNNVTLSAPTGWETQQYNGSPPDAGDTESFYEYGQTDAGLGGGGFTMDTFDLVAWETQTGMTVDTQTIPSVSPPTTVSGAYKIYDDSLGNWTSVSSFTITDGGIFDSAAPILSSPTGTETGATTASGTVITDEGNGILYYYASTNSSETAATIKASGSIQAVSVTGVQNVFFAFLTPATTYYAHYVQDDVATNESNVVSSGGFTTDEAPDTTAPILSSPTGNNNGSFAATGTVSTDESGGLLYYLATTNASETAATIKAGANNQPVSSTGAQAVSVSGLAQNTTYYLHYVQDDASSNESNVVSSTSFTTDIATGGGFNSYKEWMESLPAGSFTTKLRVFLEGKGYSGSTTTMLYEYLKTVSSKNNHQERKNDWEDGGWN